jgi:hypothetical protein
VGSVVFPMRYNLALDKGEFQIMVSSSCFQLRDSKCQLKADVDGELIMKSLSFLIDNEDKFVGKATVNDEEFNGALISSLSYVYSAPEFTVILSPSRRGGVKLKFIFANELRQSTISGIVKSLTLVGLD